MLKQKVIGNDYTAALFNLMHYILTHYYLTTSSGSYDVNSHAKYRSLFKFVKLGYVCMEQLWKQTEFDNIKKLCMV